MSQNSISDFLLLLLGRRQVLILYKGFFRANKNANIEDGVALVALPEYQPHYLTLFNTVSFLEAVSKDFSSIES